MLLTGFIKEKNQKHFVDLTSMTESSIGNYV